MLKNYTVIVKNVKKDKHKNMLTYLSDDKHKNHTKNATEIYELSNANEFEKITKDKLKKNEENYYNPDKGYRGGRKLKVVNKSFTFNLPKSYKEIASVEKCKEIDLKLKKAIIKIFIQLGIEINENELYSVLHYQDNPHIHLIIPYLDKEGNTIRAIKPKGFTSRLKILFSQVVDNVLNTDINNYKKLNQDENGQNRTIQAMEEIKNWYQTIIKIDGIETKYYKNQIISINRILKDNQEITKEQVNKINNNMNKAYDLRIKAKIKTPQAPFR